MTDHELGLNFNENKAYQRIRDIKFVIFCRGWYHLLTVKAYVVKTAITEFYYDLS